MPGRVYFTRGASEWIAATGIRLFIADCYENYADPEGFFVILFGAGIATVCLPENLAEIREDLVHVTALLCRMRGVTQIPCRVVAVERT